MDSFASREKFSLRTITAASCFALVFGFCAIVSRDAAAQAEPEPAPPAEAPLEEPAEQPPAAKPAAEDERDEADDEQDETEPPKEELDEAVKRGDTAQGSPLPSEEPTGEDVQREPVDSSVQEGPLEFEPSQLGWDGSFEMDVGYADYTLDLDRPDEDFHDFRGRLVVGPVFTHEFGNGYYFRTVAQLVGWVREVVGTYQVNVDDLFLQAGKRDLWDVRFGRFETWRVFPRGLGFDIFTLEDTGAKERGTYEGGAFGVDMYEANYIHLRETAGRAALHLYPTKWSGLQLLGTYGKDGTANTYGWRAAGKLDFPNLTVSAAGEWRRQRPAEQQIPVVEGVQIECEACGVQRRYGFGGGVIFKLRPIELSVSGGKAYHENYKQEDGEKDLGSGTTETIGGYAQFDLGSVIDDNFSLILGAGGFRTEQLLDNDNFRRHIQLAGYIAYPLGFNNAMVKLVVSRAHAMSESDTGNVTPEGQSEVYQENGYLNAARVRMSFWF